MLNARRLPLRVSIQLHRVKNIVGRINDNEKTCSGFGSITQVMALRPGLGELMTRRHVTRRCPPNYLTVQPWPVYTDRKTGMPNGNRL